MSERAVQLRLRRTRPLRPSGMVRGLQILDPEDPEEIARVLVRRVDAIQDTLEELAGERGEVDDEAARLGDLVLLDERVESLEQQMEDLEARVAALEALHP